MVGNGFYVGQRRLTVIDEMEVGVTGMVERKNKGKPTVATAGVEERMLIQSATVEGKAPPASVLLAPWGEVVSANGTFVLDGAAGRSVIEAFDAHGTDIPIDYEHQSLGGAYASPNGQAPAAGWIKGLRVVAPKTAGDGKAGLFADVEWTETAREKLAAKEYRYLSPVVIVRTEDRRVTALHSAALTNKPAIVGMKPIVNRQGSAAGDVEPTLPAIPISNENTSDADFPAEFEVLRAKLMLPSDCEAQSVLSAAAARIDALTDEVKHQQAADKVARAVAAGKVAGAQREWAMALAMKDPAAFDAWAATAPQVVMLGRTESPNGGGDHRNRTAVVASARATYRSDPALQQLTSERAWVADALRERGLDVPAESIEDKS